MVYRFRVAHGEGPAWLVVACDVQPKLRDDHIPALVRVYSETLIRAVAARGFLTFRNMKGSLAPGAAYFAERQRLAARTNAALEDGSRPDL